MISRVISPVQNHRILVTRGTHMLTSIAPKTTSQWHGIWSVTYLRKLISPSISQLVPALVVLSTITIAITSTMLVTRTLKVIQARTHSVRTLVLTLSGHGPTQYLT